MALSEQDREALFRLLHNEGDGGIWEHFDRENAETVTDALVPTVAAIVARHVNAALTEAAERIEVIDPIDWALAGQHAGTDAARIVRDLRT